MRSWTHVRSWCFASRNVYSPAGSASLKSVPGPSRRFRSASVGLWALHCVPVSGPPERPPNGRQAHGCPARARERACANWPLTC